MADIDSAASGPAEAGSTWVGGVAPGPSDRGIVLSGHTVTVTDTREWGAFYVLADGLLHVDGGLLRVSLDSNIPGHTSGDVPRVLIENGGAIEGNPASGVTARIILGTSGGERFAGLHAIGTASVPVAIRKAAGALGTFQITVPDDGTSPPGTGSQRSLFCQYAEISVDSLIGAAYGTGARITLQHCEITAPVFALNFYGGGCFTIEDNRFLGGDDSQTIKLLSWVNATAGSSTLKRNRFGRSLVEFSKQADASNFSGMEAEDNVYLGKIGSYNSEGMTGVLSGAFCYATLAEHGANTYNLGGMHQDVYQFIDFGDGATAGNPHFIFAISNLTITNAVWDYRGGGGVDLGDCIDGGQVTLRNGIILPATRTDGGTVPLPAGVLWTLGGGADLGILTVERCTVFGALNRSPIGFPHNSAYSGPADRVRVRETLAYGAETDKPPLVFADLSHTEGTATLADNAGWNLGTFADNTIGGVGGQSLKGFSGLHVPSAPTFIDLDGSGGPGFVDAGRNFIRWCREARSHTGTDGEVIAAGIADIVADPTLTRLSLLPWVRAGYRPQNDLLYDAGRTDDALSGRWIGAVSGTVAATLTIRGNATSPVNCANLYEVYPAEAVTWSVVSGSATIDADTGMLITGGTAGSVVIRATGASGYGEHTITVHAYDVPALGMTGPFAALIGTDPNPSYVAAEHITPALGDRPLLPSLGPLADLTTPSRHLPVSPYDAAIMAYFRTGAGSVYGLKAGDAFDQRWGSNGMALVTVPQAQAEVPIAFVALDWGPHGESVNSVHSDPGPWPIPANARTQSNPTTTPIATIQGDQHLCIIREDGWLFESYHTTLDPKDGWRADNGWVLDTNTGYWAPNVTDPADGRYVPAGKHRFPAVIVTAAGLPILPLCVRYEEVYVHGIIRHRMGFTLPNVKIGGTCIWPGRGIADSNGRQWLNAWGPTLPYAATWRLTPAWYHANVEAEDGTPIGTWGPGSRVVLRCLYDYGMMLTDGGGTADMWVVADSRFHEEDRYTGDLIALNSVPLRAFEVVDFGPDLLTVEQTPDPATVGQVAQFALTYHGWTEHPEEHPGNTATIVDPRWGWTYKAWEWTAQLREQPWNEPMGGPAEGEPAGEDGQSVVLTPGNATGVIAWMVAGENYRYYPRMQLSGAHWDYHADLALVARTSETPISIEVSPLNPTVAPDGTIQFATVTTGCGQNDPAYSVSNGSITPYEGLYTAPAVEGAATLTAGSLADPRIWASTTITIAVVAVSPSTTTVYIGGTRQFAATVDGVPSEDVTWSITSGTGTIDPDTGLYTAPDTPGSAIVRAATSAGPLAYADATVFIVFPGDRHGPTQFLSITDRIDPVFQGATAAFTITLRDRDGRALTGVYDGTEGLDFDLWVGDDAAEADLGSSTVSWLDADAGTVSVLLAGVDTALLEPPGYWFRLWLTDGGDKLGAFREWLQVEPSAGEGTPLRVYGGFPAIVDEFGGAVDLINRSPNVKTDLSDLRHKAARWVDGVVLARLERDLRRQLREHGPIGWVEGPMIVDGVDHGPEWGPSTLVDPTLEDHLQRYREAIAAGAVMRTPELEEIATARALGLLLLQAAGSDKDSPYLGLGMSYKVQAARMLAGYAVRLDLDADDVADAEARP